MTSGNTVATDKAVTSDTVNKQFWHYYDTKLWASFIVLAFHFILKNVCEVYTYCKQTEMPKFGQ